MSQVLLQQSMHTIKKIEPAQISAAFVFVNLKFQHLSLGSLENKISVGCYVAMSRAEKTGCDIIGSAYSRIYVFDCPHDAVFNAYFKKIHSETRFQKDCIIINRIH